ncbi:MAG: riboflavin biosynthesis protein RibF [Phycisphaerales bacterium]|nr:riboflavin biosynthesis protein RibF [Phycisphaerales bacterium]
MTIHDGLELFSAPAVGTVLTIGNFDGVHRGHAALLAAAQRLGADTGAQPLVVTFDRHPLAVLSPERVPPTLTTLSDKLALLARNDVADVLILRAEPDLLALSAEDFLAGLVARARPRVFVEGPDFSFGRGRGGSVATLKACAARWGYRVEVLPPVHCEQLPTQPRIHSSAVRQALWEGRIEDATALLGRFHRVVGETVGGAGRGRHLGFATANLSAIPQMLPQEAVYACIAELADGLCSAAAVNVGPQPTFDQPALRVEAHLLDYNGDLRGQRVALHFLRRLRGQQKFAGTKELVAQIEQDVAETAAAAGQVLDIPVIRQGLLVTGLPMD